MQGKMIDAKTHRALVALLACRQPTEWGDLLGETLREAAHAKGYAPEVLNLTAGRIQHIANEERLKR